MGRLKLASWRAGAWPPKPSPGGLAKLKAHHAARVEMDAAREV
jgi:hypothetical protein